MERKILTSFIIALALFTTRAYCQSFNYDVGVFYMPYFHNLDPPTTQYLNHQPVAHNWHTIEAYDSYVLAYSKPASWIHIPLNIYYPSPVWYDETMKSVTEKQLDLMSQYNIDFVIYDSYFDIYHDSPGDAGRWIPYWDEVLKNWKEPGFNNHGINFAIMWADKFETMVTGSGNSCAKFFNTGGGLDKMIDYWKPYVTDSRYKKIDGKPAFYIYNNGIRNICEECQSSSFFPSGYNTIDSKVNYMLSYMEDRFLGTGNNMYYVATVAPPTIDVTVRDNAVINYPVAGGYDATTTYGYKYWNTTTMSTYTYATMQGIYQTYYNHILSNSSLKYQVPVTAGWSEGPRNKKYCDDPNDGIPCPGAASPSNGYHAHPIDNAISNPTSFRESLINARNTLLNNPSKTNKVVTICCWNEYEEGSYIEPTGDGGQYGWGYQYLQKVSEVFATLNCLDGYYTINGATNNIGTGNIINTGYTSARVVCDNATSYTWTKTSGSLSYTSNGPNAYFTMTSGQSISFIVTAKNSSNQVIGTRNIAFYNFGSFAAYPNPSSEILNIEVNEDLAPDIVLLDEKQKKIKEVKKYKAKSGIDISTLKPGTYFLHVYLEDKLVNSQQIKIEK